MAQITQESPFPTRFKAWIDERFPLSHGVLFFFLYATAVLVGRFSVSEGAIALTVHDFVGFFAAWSFFLMLRVFDEHKDYEEDLVNYPDRVLQSGLITLRHLKVVGAVAIVFQLGISLFLDGGFGSITIWWLLVFAYSLLMAKEFFVREWLTKRLLIYAVSHMLIMPFAMMWMAQIGAGSAPMPWQAWLLSGVAFFSGAAFEVARKLRAPEEEMDGVASYTKVLGLRWAPIVVFLALITSAAVLAAIMGWVFGGIPAPGWIAGLVLILAIPAAALFKFQAAPTPKSRKLAEGLVSMSMLASYIVVMAAILVDRGMIW